MKERRQISKKWGNIKKKDIYRNNSIKKDTKQERREDRYRKKRGRKEQ